MIPFFDYRPDPQFLLSFAELFLSLSSLIFGFIVAIGPIGMVILVLIPVAYLCWNIYQGPMPDHV